MDKKNKKQKKDSTFDKFKDKHLGKIGKFFSWAINIIALILSILSFSNHSDDIGWKLLSVIIIFNCVLLIAVSIYETFLFKHSKQIEDTITKNYNRKVNDLSLKLNSTTKLSLDLRYYYKYIISSLNKFSTKLYAVNTSLQESIKNIETLQEITEESPSELKDNFINNFAMKTNKEYHLSMLNEYNHFLSNIITKLKFILDASLKEKQIDLEVSISVKQFNRIILDPKNIKDINVITTFRDNKTYSQNKREVGKIKYNIFENTDFIHCMTNPYFLKNNISSNDKSYKNEHTGFIEYYNCTIVVPIVCEYPETIHYYGYLTCDVLNNNLNNDDIFDDKMADIMIATARVIGIYFDNLEFQWECILGNDFLDNIFDLIKDNTNGMEFE